MDAKDREIKKLVTKINVLMSMLDIANNNTSDLAVELDAKRAECEELKATIVKQQNAIDHND
jgi:hypothetical protein